MLVTGTGVSGTVTVSNVDGTTVTLSSAQNISSTTITFSEYWTGSAWSSTATNLTVDAQGVYTVPLAFYETTVSKTRYWFFNQCVSILGPFGVSLNSIRVFLNSSSVFLNSFGMLFVLCVYACVCACVFLFSFCFTRPTCICMF